MTRTRNVTSADVAREAGVSRATVSYALNGTADLLPDTRRKVFEAAARLGYAPSAAARILRRGRSDLIVLVLPDWPVGYAAGRTIDLLSKGFAESGHPMVTYQMNASIPDQWTRLWNTLTPAAVVAVSMFDPDEQAAMTAAGIHTLHYLYPELAQGARTDREGAFTVGRRQVEYLRSAGHTQIGYAGSAEQRLSWLSNLRLEGVRRACAEFGLEPPVVHPVGTDVAAATAAVRAWADAHPSVSAVAAYNDDVAMALIAGARGAGVEIPDQLAVIGVDNIPAGRLVDPPLTTVNISMEAMASDLIHRTLVELCEDTAAPAHGEREPLKVIVRRSA